jgi:hypothetical protein
MRNLPALALFLVTTTVSAQTPADLVAKGLRLFDQKKYAPAAESFRQAVRADKKHAVARFHYARAMAALRDAGKVCEHNAYRHDIMHQVIMALQLDPSLRARIRQEPVLKVVRDKVSWQLVVEGRSLGKPEDVDAILRAATWHGQMHGICGGSSLKFNAKGVVELWQTELVDSEAGGCRAKLQATGTYAAKGATVTVKFPNAIAGRKTFTGTLSRTGSLGLPDELNGPYSDDPDECSI